MKGSKYFEFIVILFLLIITILLCILYGKINVVYNDKPKIMSNKNSANIITLKGKSTLKYMTDSFKDDNKKELKIKGINSIIRKFKVWAPDCTINEDDKNSGISVNLISILSNKSVPIKFIDDTKKSLDNIHISMLKPGFESGDIYEPVSTFFYGDGYPLPKDKHYIVDWVLTANKLPLPFDAYVGDIHIEIEYERIY
jgi:uncharacterized protein YpmB